MNLKDLKTVYFLGIGGIGMSALARYFKATGLDVHGYDKTCNDYTTQLESEGFKIHYHEDISAIPQEVLDGSSGIAIYTPAVPASHSELVYLKDRGIRVYKRSEVLGIISGGSYTIAVAGTHGKTTTSSMIAHMLYESGINFTAFLGGISSNFNSNYVHYTEGRSLFEQPLMVVEADEFDRSFLHLSPDIAIVTSTDADHLDIYGAHEEVKKSFTEFVLRTHADGTAIIRQGLEPGFPGRVLHYGGDEASQARYTDIGVRNHDFYFTYSFEDKHAEIRNALPGFHNVENATAALTACLSAGVPLQPLIRACASFKGVKRRFEYIYRDSTHTVIDDYAHHPTELRACISSVRELYPGKKLTGIFQPHLYSRTRDFADEFAEALDMLDECWLMDIYPARELPIEGVNSEFLALKMRKNPVLISKENILKNLAVEKPELLLILGAGDIDQLIKPIRKYYEKVD